MHVCQCVEHSRTMKKLRICSMYVPQGKELQTIIYDLYSTKGAVEISLLSKSTKDNCPSRADAEGRVFFCFSDGPLVPLSSVYAREWYDLRKIPAPTSDIEWGELQELCLLLLFWFYRQVCTNVSARICARCQCSRQAWKTRTACMILKAWTAWKRF